MTWAKAKDLFVAAMCGLAMVWGLMNGSVFISVTMGLGVVFFLLPRPTPLIVRWRRWKERQSRSEPSD